MKLRIFLAGGSGFIGSVLSRKLGLLGHEVTIFDLSEPAPSTARSRAIVGDVRDKGALQRAIPGHDVIVNLAAAHLDNVRPISLYEEVNVLGGRNVCQVAAEAGVRRIVFTSSVAVYGESPSELTEDSPHRALNEYGRSKSAAEREYTSWAESQPGRSLVIVRPTVVFGPQNRGNVYTLIRQLHSRRFVMIGSGSNRKSIAYVENVAGFLAHVLSESDGIKIYNYADKPDFTMRELVDFLRAELSEASVAGGSPARKSGRGNRGIRIPAALATIAGAAADFTSRLIGRPLPVSGIRIRKFMANTQISSARAFATGFVPDVRLQDGLRRMIQAEFSDAGYKGVARP